jgi:hypothetical protein
LIVLFNRGDPSTPFRREFANYLREIPMAHVCACRRNQVRIAARTFALGDRYRANHAQMQRQWHRCAFQ